jgi:alkylated DNA nucleotide flippase Atl1
MAAQGGIRDKILRVSMPFVKGRNSTRKSTTVPPLKRLFFGSAKNPWAVVLKVHSWAKQLKEGRVHSFAEIARMEGITRALVSQLWPLSGITKEQAADALGASKGKEISLRRLIRIARNPGVK